jgi:hypothetical protein
LEDCTAFTEAPDNNTGDSRRAFPFASTASRDTQLTLCILIGSITAIVLTVKIDLSIPASPFSTPNNIGSVSLIIVRYDRQPPYAMMSMLMEMK